MKIGDKINKDSKEQIAALPDRRTDFLSWYNQVVLQAELADYSPVQGCMVIRPLGYAVWEQIQHLLNQRLKATDHVNAYFPLLTPESILRKEEDTGSDIERLSSLAMWCNQEGNKTFDERLAIRASSETIIGTMYSKWVQTYRDLPILMNQWTNVMRGGERPTIFFLRTSEFLWQEGHTAHALEVEANAEAQLIVDIYKDFVETNLALPVIVGQKSELEQFTGAKQTYSIEALMGDGRALQAGTCHNFGQNYSKALHITFLDQDGQRRYVWQTSWGVSTRLIGALIMVHGDQDGLILPPKVAPIQVVLISSWDSEKERAHMISFTHQLQHQLGSQFRVKTDLGDDENNEKKLRKWQMRGIPLSIEIRPNRLAEQQVLVIRRDTQEVSQVQIKNLNVVIEALLSEIQENLYQRALHFQNTYTYHADDLGKFKEILDTSPGFIYAHWCQSPVCETAIKEQTGATIRNMPFHCVEEVGACLWCGDISQKRVLFAYAY